MDYVNTIGACRVFLRAAWETTMPWTQESEQLLSRADLDWSHQAAHLTQCHLACPLLKRLKDPELTRWAPQFFVERLRIRAIQDELRKLIQREAIRRITLTLHEIGGRGILLKGSALLFLEGGATDPSPGRATGDVDLYIDQPLAPVLRRKLMELGFNGAVDAARTAPHHLAPVYFYGIPLEIHERIMPAFWGLPEKEMLAHARPVNGMEPLSTLDPEGFILHAGMHASAHLFSCGLKTAWDLLWILKKFPELDWDRLANWVAASRIPRGFWVPVRVLCRELDLPVPLDFLDRAPVDKAQRKLEIIACSRLFHTIEGPYELNPFSKNAVFILLHDSWLRRVQYLVALVRRDAAEARRSARRNVSSQAFTQIPRQLRQAFFDWQQYRHEIARTMGQRGA